MINTYFYIFIILVSVIFQPVITSSISYSYISIQLFMVFLTLLFFFKTNNNDKNLFRVDTLFILGFVIVHFQWPLMIITQQILPIRFDNLNTNIYYMNYGTWISQLGLTFWMLGYSFFNFNKKKSIDNSNYIIDNFYLYIVTYVLFILFVIFAGERFYSKEVYSYGGSESIKGIGGYILTLLIISIIMLTFTVIYNLRFKTKNNFLITLFFSSPFYVLLSSSYILLFLFVGDRGTALQLISVFILCYAYFINKIYIFKFLSILISGAFVLTVIGFYRGIVDSNIEINTFYDLTINLANSARTLYLGISNIIEGGEIYYGKLWIGNILGIIPFAQNIFIEISGYPIHMLNTANYITYLRYGLNPHTGEGSTVIIDLFMNWGKTGVVIFMFLFGIFFRKINDEFIYGKNINWLIVGSLVGAVSFYIGRANIFTPIKMILWGLIISKFLLNKKYLFKNENI